MHRHSQAKRAFMLIEILIVIAILGILAALVIPKFTLVEDDAQANSVANRLQTIRSQIELYNMRNPGQEFDGSSWEVLTTPDPKNSNSRYIQSEPRNSMRSNVTGITTSTTPGTDDGWYWDANDKILYAFDREGNVFDGFPDDE